jgi:hypothetical protein
MFLLSFIPDALIQLVVNGVLIAGIVGCVVSFFFGFFIRWMPWIIPYRMILQILGLVLLIAGVYFKGGVGVEMEWRERVKVAQEQVKAAEERAEKINKDLEQTKKEKDRAVAESKTKIKETIVIQATTIDEKCKVAPEVLSIINDAAKKPK